MQGLRAAGRRSVLEPAHAENTPSFPKPALTIVGALLIGAMLGVVAALMHDWMDQRLQSVEQVNRVLGLHVVGLLPKVLAAQSATANRQVELEPMSESAEAYRSLRTAIHFGLHDSSAKTLLITSPNGGDGKSTTASNLAITLAQGGKRTLLIDADLRKPVQHRTFGLSRESGISDLMLQGTPLEPALKRTPVTGLDVLTAGNLRARIRQMF